MDEGYVLSGADAQLAIGSAQLQLAACAGHRCTEDVAGFELEAEEVDISRAEADGYVVGPLAGRARPRARGGAAGFPGRRRSRPH